MRVLIGSMSKVELEWCCMVSRGVISWIEGGGNIFGWGWFFELWEGINFLRELFEMGLFLCWGEIFFIHWAGTVNVFLVEFFCLNWWGGDFFLIAGGGKLLFDEGEFILLRRAILLRVQGGFLKLRGRVIFFDGGFLNWKGKILDSGRNSSFHWGRKLFF